jgi:hypothetical protein
MSEVNFVEAVKPMLVPIESVMPYPDNPRRGDVDALMESIQANGFYSTLLVQDSTGYIVAGNHRLQALSKLGATEVPIIRKEMSDEDARRIVLADNRTSDLSFYDDPTLFKLLDQMEGDFSGTGYDQASFELLLQGMEGDSILGNVSQGNTPEDRYDGFKDIDLRNIVLPYAGEAYDEVAGGLKQIREREDLESNADVVAWLVSMATT